MDERTAGGVCACVLVVKCWMIASSPRAGAGAGRHRDLGRCGYSFHLLFSSSTVSVVRLSFSV